MKFLILILLLSPASFAARVAAGPQAFLERTTVDGYVNWSLKCSRGVSGDTSVRCVITKVRDGLLADRREVSFSRIQSTIQDFLTKAGTREAASVVSSKIVLKWRVSWDGARSEGALAHTHGLDHLSQDQAKKIAILALEHALDWELTRARLKVR